MRTLYHSWLDASSRKARLHLAEKGLSVTLCFEKTWQRRPDFFRLNPAGEVPVLDDDGTIVSGGSVITEYLEETYTEKKLLPDTLNMRLEVRRLNDWMDRKFQSEVTAFLVEERVTKQYTRTGHPNGETIRAGRVNLKSHMGYLGFLLDQRHWIAGDLMTTADIAVAAHISCLDYIDEIDWAQFETIKAWYQRFKSRPSMREILNYRVAELEPPAHYDDLDF